MQKLSQNDLGFIEGYYKALLSFIRCSNVYNMWVKDAVDSCPEDREVLESLFSKEDMKLLDVYL